MKKLTALMCVFILLLSSCNIFALQGNSELNELKALNLTPSSVTQENGNEPAVWEEIIFAAEKIAGVDIVHYIEEKCNTKSEVRYADLCRIAVKILGYEQFAIGKGADDQAYVDLAELCGITKEAITYKDDILTKNEMVTIFHNIVFDNFNDVCYSLRDGDLIAVMENSKNDSLLAEKFGISVYTGTITSVNLEKNTMVLSAIKNKYEDNPTIIAEGTSVSFEVQKTIDLYEFEHMKVAVWVNKDEEVTNIFMLKGSSVKYGYISSVNGDMNEDASYSINYMKRLTLGYEEEEYDISPSAIMKFNGKATVSPKKVTGKFAKIVMYDEEISYIECWELSNGGLITEIDGNILYYNQGIYQKRFNDLSQYTKSVYIIGDRCSDKAEIKTESVFNYYIDGNFIIMVLSEKRVYETLTSINESGKRIQLGGNVYMKEKDTYFSKDGKTFKKNLYNDVLGTEVMAYFAPNGKVSYVSSTKDNYVEFYGIVTGFNTDIFGEKGEIRLIVIGSDLTENMYEFTEKTDFADITTKELEEKVKDIEGKGIYYFKIDKNYPTVIKAISRPKWFEGYGEEAIAEVSTFDSYSGLIARATVNNKRIYFTGSKIIAVYEDDEGFKARFITWMELHGRQTEGEGVKIAFYSQGRTEYPEIALITGGVNKIGSYYSRKGIVIGKELAINEKGEECVSLEILSDGVKKYNTSVQEANKIPLYSLINFYDEIKFSNSQIYLESVDAILSGDYTTWNDTFQSGIIESVAGTRVYFADGEAMYFNQSGYFIVSYDSETQNNKLRFKVATTADIQNGDTIYYLGESGQINMAVIVS